MTLQSTLEQLGPLVVRRNHPEATHTLDSAARAGMLKAVPPGVYLLAAVMDDLRWRIAAVVAWSADAVICGSAAAWLTFWPELRVTAIDAAVRTRVKRQGFRFHRRRIPPELIVERRGVRMTSPALTAVDLIADLGADVIDCALRSRRVTLDQLWEAFRATSYRSGNAERRRLLLDSRTKPWSAAERLAHRMLRTAGIRGWQANHPVFVDGQKYFIDIAFRGARLAVEIDGRLHEDDPDVFQNDRYRQNALVEDGWTVLRFTYGMLVGDPEYVIATIRRTLRRCTWRS
jgi:very-short-patch-repair endonuclease